MKIYDSFAPNPRALRMFLHEKGIQLPTVEIDILGGENRREPYLQKNPSGQLPALELDDGRVIGETVAIFEYLEEKFPTPHLIGATAEERAEARCWQRRVELQITEFIHNSFRFGPGIELFRERMHVLPEAAAGMSEIVKNRLAWLDKLMEGKAYLAGERFTMGDIILYVAVDFNASIQRPIDPTHKNLTGWMARVSARPSASASLHPRSAELGMRG